MDDRFQIKDLRTQKLLISQDFCSISLQAVTRETLQLRFRIRQSLFQCLPLPHEGCSGTHTVLKNLPFRSPVKGRSRLHFFRQDQFGLCGGLLRFCKVNAPDFPDIGDIFRRPERPALTRIESRAAGTRNPMGTIDFSHRKQTFDIFRFPPEIPGKPPVVMLGADRNLQHIRRQINPVIPIKFNGRRIQFFQPFKGRCFPQTAGAFQINFRLIPELFRIVIRRIGTVVQKNTPSPLCRFNMHKNINERRSRHMPCCKGPLIPFQENMIRDKRLIFKVFPQKFPFVTDAVRCPGNEPGQHLHVTAGDIPPERSRSQTELEFGQIPHLRTDLRRKPDRTCVNRRIDAVLKQAAGTANSKHNIFRKNSLHLIGMIRKDSAADVVIFRFQQFDSDLILHHFNVPAFHFRDQRATHLPGRVGPATGGTASGIMIRFVAGELTEGIVWKRYAKARKMGKRHR